MFSLISKYFGALTVFIHGEVGEVLAWRHQLNIKRVQKTSEGAGGRGVLDAQGDFVRLPPVGNLGREARVALQHQEPVVTDQGAAQNVTRVPRHLKFCS